MSEQARHAKVVVPEHGSYPAIVELSGDHATATLLVRPLRSLADAIGGGVEIDIASQRGLMQLDAQVVEVLSGDVLELSLTGRSIVQRRDFARVDAFLEVEVTPAGGDGTVAAAAVNVSGSGAVISRLRGLEPGDEATLSLRLGPSEPPIEIHGRVVREFADDFRALHFERIHEADRERIVRFVFERQRLELRHGRA